MEKHYEGLADQVVNGVKERRARANERHIGLAESIASTRRQLEQFAKDDRERAAEFKKKARNERAERTTANMERVAEAGRMMQGYHKDSTERAKSFKQVLAAARAARNGRGANGKGAIAEPGKKTSPSNGRRKKAKH